MLVYGDRVERVEPEAVLARIAHGLAEVAARPGGLARHAGLVSVLVESGRLLQGLCDADLGEAGCDRLTPTGQKLAGFMHELAYSLCRSWDSGFTAAVDLPRVPELDGLPRSVELKIVEGYAFYAVYPEAYIEAARALRLSGPARVIGIRSIGTSLAAVAAAALDAPVPFTVRPAGDPFDRRISVAPHLREALLAPPDAHYVIVDEGPGLSGSSFAAVADWLQGEGVPLERIAFLPSHASDPGAPAGERRLRQWHRSQRAPADLGPRLPSLIRKWIEESIGPVETIEEVSGGAWRTRVYANEAAWPAVDPQQERRKFLVSGAGETWLAKFAGLGAEGERKLAHARALHAAGLAPEPRALVHGFLIERWHGEAARGRPPLPLLAGYIARRAQLFPAGPEQGATLPELLEMSRRNVGLAAGADAAAALEAWEPLLPRLTSRVVPVAIDNAMDVHEWLSLPDGRWLKADALDHHAGHDLVGCQDPAWDVAGAAVELGLGDGDAETLRLEVGRRLGRLLDRELCAFLTLCYLAFRLGHTSMAIDRLAGWPAERDRLQSRYDGYLAQLRSRLDLRARTTPELFGCRNEPDAEPTAKSAVQGVEEEATQAFGDVS